MTIDVRTRAVKQPRMQRTWRARAFGLLSIHAMNHPFSVSSTRANPDLPKCFTNSVNVTQRVEFIWMCSLS